MPRLTAPQGSHAVPVEPSNNRVAAMQLATSVDRTARLRVMDLGGSNRVAAVQLVEQQLNPVAVQLAARCSSGAPFVWLPCS